MEAGIAAFTARLQQPWLTSQSAQAQVLADFQRIATLLETLPVQTFVVIATECQHTTLAAVLAVLATGRATMLGNPHWTADEVQTAQETLGGEQLWLETTHASSCVTARPNTKTQATLAAHGSFTLRPVANARAATLSADQLTGTLLIPTGGTGGRLKLAYHNWQTLSAAIEGYARFWNLERINSVCALPVCHIGGLMLALRTFASAGRLCLLPWKELQELAHNADAAGANADLPDLFSIAAHWHISLVPTQVQRLLDSPIATQWLRSMQAVLIGGGASRPELLRAAAAQQIPLCPAYGMTETAATIALQRPENFLREWLHIAKPALLAIQGRIPPADTQPDALPQPAPAGEVLPHLSARIEEGSGRIILSGASLFYGYYPQPPHKPDNYATGDHGEADGSAPQLLRVLGRLDRVVVSGGKKIDPALVEHAIYAGAQELDYPLRGVLVTGVADAQWGERLVAFIENAKQQPDYPASEPPQTKTAQRGDTLAIAANSAPLPTGDTEVVSITQALQRNLRNRLAAHQIPKQWITVEALPLNARGKPDHKRINELAGN